METEHVVEQTIETIRASIIEELRNGHPHETMTQEELTNVVDWVLREASDALKDALGGEIERARWWNNDPSPGHIEWFRGGLTKDYPLPRYPKDVPQ